jgi:hypothetical protein
MPGTPNTGNPTNTFAVDNTQRYQVIAQTYCRRILVQENYNSTTPPTADLLMSEPAGATQVAIPKGTSAIYTTAVTEVVGSPYFKPGQVAGEIETVSGSITVQQIESQEV